MVVIQELRSSDEIQFFHELVARLNNQLHGFKVSHFSFMVNSAIYPLV